MKRKRKVVKTKNNYVQTLNLEGINVHPLEEDKSPERSAEEISLNATQSNHIVNALTLIEQRLETSEQMWKLFFHKLLEIRTNLESQEQGPSIIKYEVKYESQPYQSDSDSENSLSANNDFPDLPLTTTTDFRNLNRACCTNSKIEQQLQNYFLKLPCEHLTLRKWCETNLSLFMTNSVASRFSWNGNKLSPIIKEPVYNAKTIKILIHCTKLKYESCFKSDIEQCIRWWFARASLRTTISQFIPF